MVLGDQADAGAQEDSVRRGGDDGQSDQGIDHEQVEVGDLPAGHASGSDGRVHGDDGVLRQPERLEAEVFAPGGELGQVYRTGMEGRVYSDLQRLLL